MTSSADAPVAIAYGRGHLPLRLPAHARVTTVRKRALPKLAEPAGASSDVFS